ncbi:MAG: hypothetical protein ACI8QF_002439 [Limisphaerales bacterium]|jgi:hypothetical protein
MMAIRRLPRRVLLVLAGLLAIPILIALLALANGTMLARGNKPEIATTSFPAA